MCAAVVETDRLVLRRFTEADAPALRDMLANEEVARFLPLVAPRSLDEARAYLDEKFLAAYRAADRGERSAEGLPLDLHYAICRKDDGAFLGYINVDADEAHDAGYALARSAWGHGYAREALAAMVKVARQAGFPFLTATHDELNPRSGRVMAACGFTYRYSYRELWQPKNYEVVFRMYQLDLTPVVPTYQGYWEKWPDHWVDDDAGAGAGPAAPAGEKNDAPGEKDGAPDAGAAGTVGAGAESAPGDGAESARVPALQDKVRGAAQMAAGAALAAAGVPMCVLPGPGVAALAGGAALISRGQRVYSGREASALEKQLDKAADTLGAAAKDQAVRAGKVVAREAPVVAAKVGSMALKGAGFALTGLAAGLQASGKLAAKGCFALSDRLRERGQADRASSEGARPGETPVEEA